MVRRKAAAGIAQRQSARPATDLSPIKTAAAGGEPAGEFIAASVGSFPLVEIIFTSLSRLS
jgi:hypothetical protein